MARGTSYRAGDDRGGLDGGAAGSLGRGDGSVGSAGRSRNGELARKPVGEGAVAGTVPVVPVAATTLLSDEERERWEEEERRLDEDIAEAERRRLAG